MNPNKNITLANLSIYYTWKNYCLIFNLNFNWKLLSKETMRLLRSTKKVITKDKNGVNEPKLEIVDAHSCLISNLDN